MAFCVTGVARTEAEKKIANLFESDSSLVIQAESSGKQILSIADLICNVCRASGATSINLVEHDMQPKTNEDSQPVIERLVSQSLFSFAGRNACQLPIHNQTQESCECI